VVALGIVGFADVEVFGLSSVVLLGGGGGLCGELGVKVRCLPFLNLKN
jgi:hypothetical protein